MFRKSEVILLTWVIAFLAWFAIPIALATPLMAQESAPQEAIPTEALFGDENIAVTLYADGLPVAGEEWMLALRFTPDESTDEEWHGYWANPGDAGLGMQLQLNLPKDWTVGEAQYPVPRRLVLSDLMNHVYKGAYTVLIPIEIPLGSDVAAVRSASGYVQYLACTDQLCVPQDALLIARPPSKSPSQFPRWQAEIAPLLDAKARFEVTSDTLRLAIPLPAQVELATPHVFIENTQLVEYSTPQGFTRVGDELVAQISVSEYADETSELERISGIISFNDGAKDVMGVRFVAERGNVPTGGDAVAGENTPGAPPALWLLFLGALAGGLLLNIMPCVFPILSLKALALAKAGGSEAQARSDGLAYTAGVVLATTALGAVMLGLRAAGEQIGWAFQLQSPGVVVVLLVLSVVITANFAGAFELPQLSFTGGGKSGKGSGKTSSFATGLLAAFVATPCTGPFMAAALGAALILPPIPALMLFAALGLGLALPFLLIGFVPAIRRMLPKPGAWMEKFRRIMAIPMGLTALALIWLTVQLGGRGFAMMALIVCFGVILGLAVVGRLQRAGKMAWPAFGLIAAPFVLFGAFALPAGYDPKGSDTAAQSIHSPSEFDAAALDEALSAARTARQPVFLWFTADWCVTCKLNEGAAIERDAVRDAFEAQGVQTMVGDWTNGDPAITRFLNEQGAVGVPLYLWYDPDSAEPEQLPQILTPDMLIERAER